VELQPGSIIEVGAGTGNFKRWLKARGRACWTLDILPGKYVDVQADALQMPLAAGSVDNIVMVDALHHFARPLAFLKHAAEILRPRGRLLLIEPFVSVWGRLVYRYLHHERVDFDFEESTASKEAWDGNAAIPRLTLNRVEQEVRDLRIRVSATASFSPTRCRADSHTAPCYPASCCWHSTGSNKRACSKIAYYPCE